MRVLYVERAGHHHDAWPCGIEFERHVRFDSSDERAVTRGSANLFVEFCRQLVDLGRGWRGIHAPAPVLDEIACDAPRLRRDMRRPPTAPITRPITTPMT